MELEIETCRFICNLKTLEKQISDFYDELQKENSAIKQRRLCSDLIKKIDKAVRYRDA